MKQLFPLIPFLLCNICFSQDSSSNESSTKTADKAISERLSNIDLPTGIAVEAYERKTPRPLRIYRATIDLNQPGLQPAVSFSADPDGEGPAETVLTPPKSLANDKGMVIAINTNAWSMIPDPQTGKAPGYIAGEKADIHGWALNHDRVASPSQEGYWTFWIDEQNKPAIDNLIPRKIEKMPKPKLAIAGFGGILRDSKILVGPSEVRHPRTAIGYNADRTQLTLVVVDGRQPKVSEGVSEEELAQLMLEFGCADAINLDGGGSSIMLAKQKNGQLRIINRPSDLTGARPVPVMFGIQCP